MRDLLLRHYPNIERIQAEQMERWVYDSRSTIMRHNTMNKFGVVPYDFGFEGMLPNLVDDFISPISQVKFNANGMVVGTLYGFDQFMNPVVENTVEVNGTKQKLVRLLQKLSKRVLSTMRFSHLSLVTSASA
ncbi:unnamed protein product [Arabis nemorensis]|uniref:Uncharacterized protein n=1 Tax=Arabis nemorensis TaxID=586526 RepID=A0A565BI22_9BRAS|nr:unnamed protein product [Arabis nemorensis]